jgi:hypothetical protein
MLARPEPPPWGTLISAALARAGLSAREAARRARLSEGRWRQITAGYQVVRPGVYASVRGPADTIARMAAVAGVTEAQLREAGRDDAAELLARQQESRPAVEQLLATIWAMDADQARSLLAMIVVQLGLSLEQRDQPDAGELTGAERPAPGLAGVELAGVELAAVEPQALLSETGLSEPGPSETGLAETWRPETGP